MTSCCIVKKTKIHQSGYWLRYLVVAWLVPRETAAVSEQVLSPYNQATVYSVTVFKVTCMYSGSNTCSQHPPSTHPHTLNTVTLTQHLFRLQHLSTTLNTPFHPHSTLSPWPNTYSCPKTYVHHHPPSTHPRMLNTVTLTQHLFRLQHLCTTPNTPSTHPRMLNTVTLTQHLFRLQHLCTTPNTPSTPAQQCHPDPTPTQAPTPM